MEISKINTYPTKNKTSFKSINIVGEAAKALPTIKLSSASPFEKDYLITYTKRIDVPEKILGISKNAEKATKYIHKLGQRILNPITIQHVRYMLRQALDEALVPTRNGESISGLLSSKELSNVRNLIEKGIPAYDASQKALVIDFNPEEKVSVVLTRAQLAALKLPQP